jgi:hypothetical protein
MIISSKQGARLSAAGFLCFFAVFEGVGGRTFSFHAGFFIVGFIVDYCVVCCVGLAG